MTKWILIIILTNQEYIKVEKIELPTQQLCLQAYKSVNVKLSKSLKHTGNYFAVDCIQAKEEQNILTGASIRVIESRMGTDASWRNPCHEQYTRLGNVPQKALMGYDNPSDESDD